MDKGGVLCQLVTFYFQKPNQPNKKPHSNGVNTVQGWHPLNLRCGFISVLLFFCTFRCLKYFIIRDLQREIAAAPCYTKWRIADPWRRASAPCVLPHV